MVGDECTSKDFFVLRLSQAERHEFVSLMEHEIRWILDQARAFIPGVPTGGASSRSRTANICNITPGVGYDDRTATISDSSRGRVK
jgi:hypothetical protein